MTTLQTSAAEYALTLAAEPKPRGRNGGRKPIVPGGSNAWLRLRIPSAELSAIKTAAKTASQDLTSYVRNRLR